MVSPRIRPSVPPAFPADHDGARCTRELRARPPIGGAVQPSGGEQRLTGRALHRYVRGLDRTVGSTVRSLGEILLGVVVLGVFAQIHAKPWGSSSSVSMETLGVILVGGLLGARRGGLATLAYVTVGVVGLPILPGLRGGWTYATGAPFGYLIGIALMAITVGYAVDDRGRAAGGLLFDAAPARIGVGIAAGTAIMHAFGWVWLAYRLNISLAERSPNAWDLGVKPYLVGDAFKGVAAFALLVIANRRPLRRRPERDDP